VPLAWEPELCAYITLRSDDLKLHPGDPCFPGGRPDPADHSLLQTALREANEELGICDADVLGPLSCVPLFFSDHRIEPYVARVDSGTMKANPGEVKGVLRTPLLELACAESIHGIPWVHRGQKLLSPVFPLGEHLVHGATAHVLWELIEIVAQCLQRTPPPLQAGQYAWTDLFVDFRAPWVPGQNCG
tara:strand:- start:2883 stop:3446 length:564 start_codon:yes stop_codon:yes gene_type:complete